jgi:hypothetical protein
MSGRLRSTAASAGPHAWLRNNILGLVAIFIALSGSAAAATVVIQHDSKGSAKAKASKKAKAGPRGPAGAQGTPGGQGAQGASGGNGATGAQGPSALKIDWDAPVNPSLAVIGVQNELTIGADCTLGPHVVLTPIFSSSVSATIHQTESINTSTTGDTATVKNQGASMDPGFNTVLDTLAAPASGYQQAEVLAVYRNASRVITLNLHMTANDSSGRCQVNGTAVPAS